MTYKGTIAANCETNRPLTGKGSCDRVEGLTSALIITGSKALYPIDQTEFINGIEGWIYNSGTLRMMPVKDIVNDTPSGGEVTTSQVGYGQLKPVSLSSYSSVFQIDAGLCLYKELAVANKSNFRVFRVDKQGYIYGTIVTQGGVDYFAGFEASLYAYTTKDTDSTNAGGVFLGVYYGSEYENEMKNINVFEVGSIPDGLIGAYLVKEAAGAKVVTACSGTDITSGQTWDVTCFVNKTGANPDTVSVDSLTGLLTISPSGYYKLASADKLKEKDILGIEGSGDYVQI